MPHRKKVQEYVLVSDRTKLTDSQDQIEMSQECCMVLILISQNSY